MITRSDMLFLLILMRIVASITTVAVLGLAAYWTLRLNYTDRLFHTGTPEGVSRAVELAPGNARYQIRWASILEDSGKDSAALAALEAAVASNPRDSASWMELGLRAERDADLKKAERYLLEAVRVDRQYDPRWTLTNFYFRRSDWDNFWLWAREAAAMSYGNSTALFRLYWRATQDPELILNRAIPDQQQVLTRYLRFLLTDNHLEAVDPVAERVVERAGPENLPVLLASCDRLLEAGRFSAALQIWTVLCQRKLVSCQVPEPKLGLSLTNGNFRTTPLSSGFDWRTAVTKGISVTRSVSPPGLRWTFSGQQLESSQLLSQYIPLLPGKQYRLQFRYQTSNIAPNTGLRWRVFDAVTGAELAGQSPHLSSENESQQVVTFSTLADTRMARLTLMYQRALGTTRIEGSISLADVSLGFALP